MIVWGGDNGGHLNDGGRYNPAANSWTAVNTTGAPAARRYSHGGLDRQRDDRLGRTDSGGTLNTGGRYNPAGNSWTAVTTTGAPAARYGHTAVWTGSEMIVWGGDSDGDFEHGRALQSGGEQLDGGDHHRRARRAHRAHGGVDRQRDDRLGRIRRRRATLNDGGRYDPAADSWTAVSTTGAPAARYDHTAVWTGSEMIVWGGSEPAASLNNGGRYNPASNSWTAVSTTGAPAARYCHTAVWTGSEMIVWGGSNGSSYLNTGGRYDPAGNSWTAVSTTGAPAARYGHTAVWTGSEMIVWGGTTTARFTLNDRRALRSGGRTLDAGEHYRRARRRVQSHGGVDGQRDDRLGRT